jgi:predicted nucleotidyltransferase
MRHEINNISKRASDAALNLFSDKLKAVILYGSFARDDYDGESDIDIFVIVDASKDELAAFGNEIAKIASRLSVEAEGCRTVSITLQDFLTFDKYKNYLPYFSNIATEGVVLYAA